MPRPPARTADGAPPIEITRPKISPTRTPGGVEARVVALRRQRRVYARIAAELGVARATVGRILARLGVTVERVMTDNGSCYRSKAFNKAYRALRPRHIVTRPYTPRTNGKAERFILSSLREWAYARAYANSDQRTGEPQHWMHHYNWHRPHAGIKGKIPISRLGLDVNNQLRLHS